MVLGGAVTGNCGMGKGEDETMNNEPILDLHNHCVDVTSHIFG